MKNDFFKQNIYFFLTWILFLILGCAMIYQYPKPEMFLKLNGYHSTALNYFFIGVTTLGDGFFIVLLALVLYFARKRALSFLIFSSFAASGIVVQLIKNVFPVPRPVLYFKLNQIDYPYFLDNITLHNHFSFPSGHTSSAFALVASIAFFSKKKQWNIVLPFVALLIGYSRIYLGQHFPEDVTAGMAIGVLGAVVCYVFLMKYFLQWEQKLNR